MVMRVTEGQISHMILLGTQNNLGRMARLQEMTATGHRVNSFADDARGVGLIRHYESLLHQNEQYRSNINRARTIVDQTDTAMQDLLEVIRDASQIARREVSGASNTWQTRAIAASEIEGIISEAMSLMNQSVEGNSLFSGYRTDIQPFVRTATGQVQYQGDSNNMTVRIGPSTELQINIPGTELLGSDRSILAGFGDLAPRLAASTALSEITHGNGWTMGSIMFTDSTGIEKSVDLSGSGTIGDIINLLNAAGLNASIGSGGTSLTITDPGGGPLTIRDSDGGSTAASLGIVGSSTSGLISGTDIRTAPQWSTNLANIESMVGAMPLGQIHLTMNQTDLTIDLSGSASLDDIRTAFETAITGAGLPPLTMELDGASMNIISMTGETWSISNEPGDATAHNLGLVGTGRPARLFGTLEALAAALRSGDVDGIRDAIGELEGIEQQVLEIEIEVGSRQNMLEWMEGRLMDRDYSLSTNLSRVRDSDMIEIASELTQAESAYQASLLVSSRLLQTNLFQYL